MSLSYESTVDAYYDPDIDEDDQIDMLEGRLNPFRYETANPIVQLFGSEDFIIWGQQRLLKRRWVKPDPNVDWKREGF